MVFPWMWSKKVNDRWEERFLLPSHTENPRWKWGRTHKLNVSAASIRKSWQGCRLGHSVFPTSQVRHLDRRFGDHCIVLLRNLLNEERPIPRLIAYSILPLLLTAPGLVRICYNVGKNKKIKGKCVCSIWRIDFIASNFADAATPQNCRFH